MKNLGCLGFIGGLQIMAQASRRGFENCWFEAAAIIFFFVRYLVRA
jgi:hypothetical protein